MRTLHDEVNETLIAQQSNATVRFQFVFTNQQVNEVLPKGVTLRPTPNPYEFTAQWSMPLTVKEKKKGGDIIEMTRKRCLDLFTDMTIPSSELDELRSSLDQLKVKLTAVTTTASSTVRQLSTFTEVTSLLVNQYHHDRPLFVNIIQWFFDVLQTVCPYEWRDEPFAREISGRFINLIKCLMVVSRSPSMQFQDGLQPYFYQMVQLMVNEMRDRLVQMNGEVKTIDRWTRLEMIKVIDREIIEFTTTAITDDNWIDRLIHTALHNPNFEPVQLLPLWLLVKESEVTASLTVEEDMTRILFNIYEYAMQKLDKRSAEAKVNSGLLEDVLQVDRVRRFVNQTFLEALEKLTSGGGGDGSQPMIRVPLPQPQQDPVLDEVDRILLSAHGLLTSDFRIRIIDEIDDLFTTITKEQLNIEALAGALDRFTNTEPMTREATVRAFKTIYYLRRLFRVIDEHGQVIMDDFPQLPLPIVPIGFELKYAVFDSDPERARLSKVVTGSEGTPLSTRGKEKVENIGYSTTVTLIGRSSVNHGSRRRAITTTTTLYRADPQFEEKLQEALSEGGQMEPSTSTIDYTDYTIKLVNMVKSNKGVVEMVVGGAVKKVTSVKLDDIVGKALVGFNDVANKYLHILQLREPSYIGVGGGVKNEGLRYGPMTNAHLSAIHAFLTEQRAFWVRKLDTMTGIHRDNLSTMRSLVKAWNVDITRLREVEEEFRPRIGAGEELARAIESRKRSVEGRRIAQQLPAIGRMCAYAVTAVELLHVGYSTIAKPVYDLLTATPERPVRMYTMNPDGTPQEIDTCPVPPTSPVRLDPFTDTAPEQNTAEVLNEVIADPLRDYVSLPSEQPEETVIDETTANMVTSLLGLTDGEITVALNSTIHTIPMEEMIKDTTLANIAEVNQRRLGNTFIDAHRNINLIYSGLSKANQVQVAQVDLTWESRSWLTMLLKHFLTKHDHYEGSVHDFITGDPLILEVKKSFLRQAVSTSISSRWVNKAFDPERLDELSRVYNQGLGGFTNQQDQVEFLVQLRLSQWRLIERSFERMVISASFSELVANNGQRAIADLLASLPPQTAEQIAGITKRFKVINEEIIQYISNSRQGTRPSTTDELHKYAASLLEGVQQLINGTKTSLGAPMDDIRDVLVTLTAILPMLVSVMVILRKWDFLPQASLITKCVAVAHLLNPMNSYLVTTAQKVIRLKGISTRPQVISTLSDLEKQVDSEPSVEVPGYLNRPERTSRLARLWNYLSDMVNMRDAGIPRDLQEMVDQLKRHRVAVTASADPLSRGQFLSNLRLLTNALASHPNGFANPLQRDTYLQSMMIIDWVNSEQGQSTTTDRIKHWGSLMFTNSMSVVGRLYRWNMKWSSRQYAYRFIQANRPSTNFIKQLPETLQAAIGLFTGDTNQWLPYLEELTIDHLGFYAMVIDGASEALGVTMNAVDFVRATQLDLKVGIDSFLASTDDVFVSQWAKWVFTVAQNGEGAVDAFVNQIPSALAKALEVTKKYKWIFALFGVTGMGAMAKLLYSVTYPSYSARLWAWWAGASDFPVPKLDETVAYFTGTVLSLVSAKETMADLSGDALVVKRVVSALNNTGTTLFASLQIMFTILFTRQPFIQNILGELNWLRAPITPLYIAGNIIKDSVAVALPTAAEFFANACNSVITHYADHLDIYAIDSMFGHLLKEFSSRAGDALVKREDIEGVVKGVPFPTDSTVTTVKRRTFTTDEVINLLSRLAKGKWFSGYNVPTEVLKMTHDQLGTLIGESKKYTSLVITKILQRIIYIPRSFTETTMRRALVEALGGDEKKNQWLQFIKGKEGRQLDGLLAEIARTEHFWQNYIEEQLRLFQLVVDVAEGTLGLQSPLSPWKRAANNGLLMLSSFLRLHVLGSWAVMAIQLVTDAGYIHSDLSPVKDQFKENVIRPKMPTGYDGSEPFADIHVVNYPPNIIAEALVTMTEAVRKTIDMMNIHLPPPVPLADRRLDQFLSPSFFLMEVPLPGDVVKIPDGTLSLEGPFDTVVRHFCNTTWEALRLMSESQLREALNKLP